MDLPPQRRSIRYNGYDYSMAGYYALTICARDRAYLFGSMAMSEPLRLSSLGELVLAAITEYFPTVRLDTRIVMPNHLHCILVLTHNRVTSVSQVVGSFKSRCYARWRRQLIAAGQAAPPSCWQRDY